MRRYGCFALLIAALSSVSAEAAAEPPFKPIPAYGPEAQAVREAAALRQEGDRLQEQGLTEKARKAWEAAVEAYHRAGYQMGEGETLFQIAVSYQAEMMSNSEVMVRMLDAMARGANVTVEFLESLARQAGPEMSPPNPEADALLSQAVGLAEAGDCVRALPLFESSGQRYAAAGSGIGELRALKGRLRCQQPNGGDPMSAMGFLAILPDFMRIAQGLQGKLKAGPAVRYLRAAESAELGKLQEAETLLRSVLGELDAAGDASGAGQAALDLGCVLIREGKPKEAEVFLKRAQEGFAGRIDRDAQRNFEAARKNLEDLASAAPQPGEEKAQPAPVPPAPESPEKPLLPEPAGLVPRAQARQEAEAVFLMGDGDRLKQAGKLKEAREKWQAAAEAFRQAADSLGLADAYRRLGDSYAVVSVSDESKRWVFIDYYIESISAAADAHESSVRKELPLDAEALVRADALRQEAARLSESGGCAQALPLLEESRRLYQRAGLAVGEVRSLMLKARCLVRSGDYVAASMTAFEALPIVEALPMRSPSSEMAVKADDLFEQGRWREALDAYQELLCRYERDKDPAGIAHALLRLGKMQASLGDYPEAEMSLQRALGLLPFVDGEEGESREATAHRRLGGVYFALGRTEEGVAELRRARELSRRSGEPEREVSALSDLAKGLAESGEYESALSVVKEAEELQHRLPSDPVTEADLLSAKSFAYFGQGRLQDALGAMYRTEDLFRRQGLSPKALAARGLGAGFENLLGRSGPAQEIFKQISEASGQEQASVVTQIAQLANLMSLVRYGRSEEAVKLGQQILTYWVQSGDHRGEAFVRGLLATSYLDLGRLDEAQAELTQAESKAGDVAVLRGLLSVLSAMTDLLRKAQAFKAAQGEPGQSGQSAQDQAASLMKDLQEGLAKKIEGLEQGGPGTQVPGDVSLPLLRLVASLLSQKDPEGSLEQVNQVMVPFDQWSQGVTVTELKAPLFAELFRFYSLRVELSIAANRPEMAFRYAEEARARAFVDQIGNQKIVSHSGADPDLVQAETKLRLQQAELQESIREEQRKALQDQDLSHLESLQKSLEQAGKKHDSLLIRLKTTDPEYAAQVSVNTLSLSEIQRQVLDEKTTLIEYFVPASALVGSGHVLAWVIDRDRFTMVQLPLTANDLENRVTEYRNLIAARQAVDAQAAALYRDLLAPLVPHVHHSNLVIVPHGVLHFLPFATLWDEKERRYLGDAYALSYAPSSTVLKFARERKAQAVGPALVAGNPDGSLPQAAAEARAIAALYGAKPLLGGEATEGMVVARAGQAGIVHLAAHTVLNQANPQYTCIELAPDAGHDGNLEMHEVFGLDLSKTGLVVLSACSTQMGKLSAGDELEGLTRAFLYAGTPAVMSSLWDVKDDSTAYLMTRFYTHLRQGTGRAEALRLAQMEIRHRFPHPYHWAAFVLTGDGR